MNSICSFVCLSVFRWICRFVLFFRLRLSHLFIVSEVSVCFKRNSYFWFYSFLVKLCALQGVFFYILVSTHMCPCEYSVLFRFYVFLDFSFCDCVKTNACIPRKAKYLPLEHFELTLNLLILGLAIKCFECNSHYNQGCELQIVPSNFTVDCSLKRDVDENQKPIQYTFCRKINQIIEFSVNQR